MSVDLKGNTNFVVLKNLQDELIVPRTNLAAVDMAVANGLSVAGSTLSITMATTEDIELGTTGSVVTPDALKPILDSKQPALEAGTGVELVAGETASTISVPLTDVETLIDGTTATKVVDVAALRGALTTGQAVDVTSAPDGVTGDYLGSFTITGSLLGFAAFPKYAKNLNYLFIATIVPTTAGTVTPSANCKWLDTGDRTAKSVAAGVSVKLAVTFTSSANTCPASFALSGTGAVTVSYCRQYEVTACTAESIAYIASLSNPDAFADYYLVKADMVQPWTPIIDMGSSPAVTIESNHSYKLLATGTHQLSVGTCPSGYTGQDALITIIVGAAGTVQTVAPLKTSATFTSASINDCVVKFRDGKAFLLVENTEEAYVVSVTSGTEEGSLPYGLANNASVIMFAPATSGQSIALSGVTATISDGVSIFGNGTASTLLAGGELTCLGELRASDLTFNARAVIKGGVLTCTNVLLSQEVRFSSCVINNASVSDCLATLNDGSVANSTTVTSGGYFNVFFGGVANNTTVNKFGYLYVSNGGMADNTTVNNFGYLYVSNGGTADSTTVNSGGSMWVSSGGTADNTTISPGGYLYVEDGGKANSTAINSRGSMYVGGTADNTTVNDFGYLYVSSGGMADNTTVNKTGYLYVSSGGTATDTTVNSIGYFNVFFGGVANNTTVNSGGSMLVSSGGTATNIVWTPCEGNIDVKAYAYVTFASEYSGVYFGSANQLLSHATIMNDKTVGGTMCVMNGGTASLTAVNSGGIMYVSKGGMANSTTIISGRVNVSSGGTATVTTVNSGGYFNVCFGGTADNTTVNDFGYLYVSSGGMADNTTISPNGRINVFSGGIVSDTTINSRGSMYVSNGGTADSTTVSPGGRLYVSSGATANSTTVNSGGSMYVSNGGTATDTTVNSGGIMYVSKGGTATDTTVNKTGNLIVSSGGTALLVTSETGAVITSKIGAYITYK